MTEAASPAITITKLSRSFGKHVVLNDITLEVGHGECVAIMGSSGGGKTTLLRCISGLLAPSAGKVLVNGVDSTKEPESARRALGMVFQSSALFDFLNVGDNIRFGLRRKTKLKEPEQNERVAEVLNMVGLEETQKLMPNELSGGMRKRVGIARALALQPKVMLYDEPTTGLDPITTYTIDQLIAGLKTSLGMTSVIVSHDVTSVFRVADRVAFLHEGELVYVGPPKGLVDSPVASIRELLEKSQATTLSIA